MTGTTLAQQRQFAERMRQLDAALARLEALAERLQARLDAVKQPARRRMAE